MDDWMGSPLCVVIRGGVVVIMSSVIIIFCVSLLSYSPLKLP